MHVHEYRNQQQKKKKKKKKNHFSIILFCNYILFIYTFPKMIVLHVHAYIVDGVNINQTYNT